MAIQLKEVYYSGRSSFQLELVAGEKGLSNFFVWPHIMENIHAINFLHGHELVITTGMGKDSDEWLKNYITGLISKEASGLIVNLGPYIEEIPTDILDLCNRNDFPLFVLPWHIHLCDLIMEFCNRIIANDNTNISNAEAIKNAIFYPNTPDLYRIPLERNNFLLEGTFALMLIQMNRVSDTIQSANFENNFLLMLKLQINPWHIHHCIFVDNDQYYLIFNQITGPQLEPIVKELSDKIASAYINYSHHIGASEVKPDITSMPSLYEQAGSALRLAKKQELPYILFQASPVNKLLLSIPSTQILQEIYSTILGPLEAFDQKHHTDYLETLRNYIESDGSILETASRMYVHRNTINYRIHKIKNLLDNKLSSPEDRFQIQLAFHIREVL